MYISAAVSTSYEIPLNSTAKHPGVDSPKPSHKKYKYARL